MAAYIVRRMVAALPAIVGVTVLVFFMLRLVPGDPARVMFLNQPPPSEEELRIVRQRLGLDLPLHRQFTKFVSGLAQGDLGTSYRSRRPVLDEIRLRLPNTLKLTGASLAVTVIVGVAAGTLAATRHGTMIDFMATLGSIVSVSIPSFWLGLMLILLFAVRLDWLPAAGADSWKHLVLPAMTLGVRSAALLARTTRAAMLDVLHQDYVRTARAKGLRELWIVYRHAFRNALLPVVTILSFQIGGLLTGSFIIEVVFAYPGLGMLAVQALSNRDFPVIQGIVLVTAVIYVLVNLIVDLLYGVLDPRVRVY